MTEFNAGLGIDVADGPYSASFILHQLVSFALLFPNATATMDTLSFWCVSDVFEEGGQASAPYTQQFGLQTVYGVPKPVYHALSFVHSFVDIATRGPQPHGTGVRVLSNGTVDVVTVVAAAADAGALVDVLALLTNFDVHPALPAPVDVEVVFAGLASAPASAVLELVDSAHAYGRPAWEAAGAPDYPSAAELAAERAAAALVPQSVALVPRRDGTWSATVRLEGFGSARISFQATSERVGQ